MDGHDLFIDLTFMRKYNIINFNINNYNMAQNIFQVISENHLDKIMKDNMQKLILIMYSTPTCKPCKLFKPKFVNLSKIHTDTLFIYIDNTKYSVTKDKYFNECTSFPTFLYYFSNTLVAYVKGADESSIIEQLKNIETKIEARKNQIQLEKQEMEKQELERQKYKNPDTEIMQKKIFMFNKLTELHNKGVKLTGTYNLDSAYEDLVFEYRYQVDPEFRQHIIERQQQMLATQEPISLPPQQDTTAIPQQQIPIPPPPQQDPIIPQTLRDSTNDSQSLTNVYQQLSPEEQELIQKQQKINQIKGLSNLEQKMQMISYQKLMQLKKLQQMKEQTEKNQNNL
jgi:thiol-disulfide isomerase/thioredoxin